MYTPVSFIVLGVPVMVSFGVLPLLLGKLEYDARLALVNVVVRLTEKPKLKHGESLERRAAPLVA